MTHLSHLGISLRLLSWYKSGSCNICLHGQCCVQFQLTTPMQQIHVEQRHISFSQDQFLHSCCLHIHPCSVGRTDVITIMGICLTILDISAPLSVILHAHYAFIIHLYQTVSVFQWVKHVLRIETGSKCKLLQGTKHPMPLPFHTDLSHKQHLNEWLALCLPIYPCYKL